MADVRVSQVVVEGISAQAPAPEIRVSSIVVEAMSVQEPSPAMRFSQVVVETVSPVVAPFNALLV
jgi:hypothetical protein